MFRQVLVPDAQNVTVIIPTEWFGMDIVILAFPISDTQSK